VLEDRFERARVTRAEKLEVAPGNLEAGHIADAGDVTQHAFQRAEAAAA
jgi:hypothetical protein